MSFERRVKSMPVATPNLAPTLQLATLARRRSANGVIVRRESVTRREEPHARR